ncbi:MAG: amino acid ABC transporter substrate-binding protein [Deltaproteobacteria bacterium]|jgi:polar amino acid transport system substrate-binding protein|nr:amino acid ABC transporter substrate-binding protein [Deltaproteobacteria bacterium]
MFHKLKLSFYLFIALLALSMPNNILAGNACTNGNLVNPGVLTIASGNPGYAPWVLDNAIEKGKGFEAAVAHEVAKRMGFSGNQIKWVSASFDQSIQPGVKNFDFNLQQFSISADREKVVDFSIPYYTANMAVLVRKHTIEKGAKATLTSVRKLVWGAVANTTGMPFIKTVITPTTSILLYDDNADAVGALKAKQIDAAVFDLPTALFISAVQMDDGVILGQFPAADSTNPDHFGMLLSEGSPLRACVNEALSSMKSDGKLAKIEAQWLQNSTGIPVIK